MSIDEWDTKEGTGKSMKNALHVQWYDLPPMNHYCGSMQNSKLQWYNKNTLCHQVRMLLPLYYCQPLLHRNSHGIGNYYKIESKTVYIYRLWRMGKEMLLSIWWLWKKTFDNKKNYTHSHPLGLVNSAKYLGVTIDSKLFLMIIMTLPVRKPI